MTENWRRGFAAAEAEVEAATCLLETLAAAWRKAMRAAIGDIFWRGGFYFILFLLGVGCDDDDDDEQKGLGREKW